MRAGSILDVALGGLVILGILNILSGYKEGFACYANTANEPLLAPGYEVNDDNKCGLSEHEYTWKPEEESYMSNYKQSTNNKKYWTSPCNGSTIPPEMCGGLYQTKKIKIPGVQPPQNLKTRVNYYDSSTSNFV